MKDNAVVPEEVPLPLPRDNNPHHHLHLLLHNLPTGDQHPPLVQLRHDRLHRDLQPHFPAAGLVDRADHPDRPRPSPHPVGTSLFI